MAGCYPLPRLVILLGLRACRTEGLSGGAVVRGLFPEWVRDGGPLHVHGCAHTYSHARTHTERHRHTHFLYIFPRVRIHASTHTHTDARVRTHNKTTSLLPCTWGAPLFHGSVCVAPTSHSSTFCHSLTDWLGAKPDTLETCNCRQALTPCKDRTDWLDALQVRLLNIEYSIESTKW